MSKIDYDVGFADAATHGVASQNQLLAGPTYHAWETNHGLRVTKQVKASYGDKNALTSAKPNRRVVQITTTALREAMFAYEGGAA